MGLLKNITDFVVGSGKASQFDTSARLAIPEKDIEAIRAIRDKEITGPRKSTQLQLEQLQKEKQANLDQLERERAGLFASLADQAALTGGLTQGATERLARQVGRQASEDQRSGIFDFARQGTALTAADFADQEALKNQALFNVAGLGTQLAGIGLSADAANLQARELAKANRQSNITGLFSSGVSAALSPAPKPK